MVAQWRLFRKAGRKGWLALIPIVNLIIMFDIIKKNRALVFLFFIPVFNLIGWGVLSNGMAKVYGKPSDFSIGLFFLPFIFYTILGFGDSEYEDGELIPIQDDLSLEDHLVE